MLKPTLAAVLLSGVLVASASQASSVSYFLNQSNRLADGINYLQVTISDERAVGVIDFTVVALQPLLDLAGDGFGIQKFAFNILPAVSTEARNVNLLPEGWRARNGGRMDGFGLYDVKLKAKNLAKIKDKEQHNQNRQDPLTFSITGVSFDTIQSYVELSHGSSPEGFSLFAAEVGGFHFGDCNKPKPVDRIPSSGSSGGHGGGKCVTNAYFGGTANAVPAPPALWLLGTAVAGLAGRRFRRSATSA